MTIRSPRGLAAALLAVLLSAPLAAQEGLDADRPGLGNGPAILPKGALQVEAGLPSVAWLSPGGAEGRVVAFPVLLRLGVSGAVELRAGASVHNRLRIRGEAATLERSGMGDLELGAKVALYRDASGSALSVVPSVVLETGHRDFTGGGAEYGVELVGAWPAGAGVTAVPGVRVASVPGGDRRRGLLGMGLGLARPVAGPVEGFVEAAYLALERGADESYAGGGLTWGVARRVQLDGFLNRGLTEHSADWLAGVGMSVRIR